MLLQAWLPCTTSIVLLRRSFIVGRGRSSMVLGTIESSLHSETQPVGVAVLVRAGVRITIDAGDADLAQDDHAGRAPVDAERASGADVVVDDEQDLVGRILTRALGAGGLDDGRRRHHVDALPRADVDAPLAHDALGLVDVD